MADTDLTAWEEAFRQAVLQGRPVSVFNHPLLPGAWTINPRLAGLAPMSDEPTIAGSRHLAGTWRWLNGN